MLSSISTIERQIREKLSPYVSFEERADLFHLIGIYNDAAWHHGMPPLNTPTYKDYERGRVLVAFNSTWGQRSSSFANPGFLLVEPWFEATHTDFDPTSRARLGGHVRGWP